MSVILVIHPDAAQGRVLNDMSRRIGADLVVVESTKKAVEAIGRQVPDLILLSAFLSPRDEDTLMGRLRSLEGASHLQTMTIPQFQTGEDRKAKKSGFGFRKKQKATVAVGADPAEFAEEVTTLLSRAREIRNRPAPFEPVRTVIAPEAAPPSPIPTLIDDEPAVFHEPLVFAEQRWPGSDEPGPADPVALVDEASGIDEPLIPADEPMFVNALVGDWSEPEQPVVAESPVASSKSIADEIDQLVRRLGLGAKIAEPEPDEAPVAFVEVPAPATRDDDDIFDFGASLDRARNRALTRSEDAAPAFPDAEAIRESALAEARAVAEREAREAREASAAEIARVQAQAEAFREAAEARAAEERQAREALAADLARAHTEAEQMREAAVAEARVAAERAAREALAADLARAQAEAEKKRQAEIAEARAAAERAAREALAVEVARAQAEAEQKRQAEVAEARAAAERAAREARAAEAARRQAEAEQKRQAEIAEARAAAERAAREALAAEAARAQAEVEQKRQAEIAEARAAAERAAREARAAEAARRQAEAEQKRQTEMAEARAAAERAAREALAAEVARAQSEAEQKREAAIAEAREAAEREAREALAADLARVQVEAEQMRQRAIAEARAAAEQEARQTLEVEVARVRSEAQSTFTDALKKVKVEAEEADRRRAEAERVNAESQQAFARELLRVRREVEQSLAAQLDAARGEAERIRAAEAEAVRERAAVETQLKAELDRLKFITAQARKADESETKKASQQIKHLEAELASMRAKAEAHKGNELEELRTQMAEMREAAAQHARNAAAEAVAAAVAAAAPRPSAVIAQFPPRESTKIELQALEPAVHERVGRDYLSLWQPKAAQPDEVEEISESDEPEESFLSAVSAVDVRRHAKWALPVAACLLLVTNTGTAISTVSQMVKTEERPPLTVVPVKEEMPFIEMVEKRVGKLQLDSTPSGAEAILDGKSFGRTPLTIPDLDAGLHTLQLKSDSGTITRKVTIKANQTTLLSEAIYSGWLAIFSPIPVKVVIDGRPVNLSEDGRAMVTPGSHVVQFIADQFNYRSSERLDVRPGETTPHTLELPMGRIRVTAPAGAAVLVDGQPAAGTPSEGLSVAIGSHEISATHPALGERRMPVDVKHGGMTEVTLRFE